MYMGGGGWAFQDGHQVAIQISHQVDTKHWHFTLTFHKMFEFLEIFVPFLAPPAERQRSFSNADSSVVRRPSSVVVVVVRRRRQLFN